MRFLDILLGRTKPARSRLDPIFSMATAQVTLTAQLSQKPGRKAGICFRPVASSDFDKTEKELNELLQISSRTTSTEVKHEQDSFGFHWVILEDEQFEDLVNTIYLVSQTLQEHGFGERLLAAVFSFEEKGQPIYWIYNYKRGKFYPFVSREGQQRDNAIELRMASIMEKELPMESSLEQWYPLWGIPF
ncbi:MAG: hypothetical protein HYX82_03315 [Chloroflexi bacterium]|nr:hypothetical protein [Chloroflexota bacterium]